MQGIVRPLLLYHEDADLRAWLVEAAGRHYHVSPMSSWEEMGRAARRASPAALAVVDPSAGGSGSPAPEMTDLIARFPSLPVVAAFDVTPGRADDLRALAGIRVAGIFRMGEESPATFKQLLFDVQHRSVRRLLHQALPARPDSRTLALLETAAAVVMVGGNGSDLAAACRASERTVLRRCVRGALPPPRRLLAWLRVLIAAGLLDEPERTIGSVAQACGYSFDGALRKAVTSLVGLGIRELRNEGAFTTAARAFAGELSRLQAERPPPPPGSNFA